MKKYIKQIVRKSFFKTSFVKAFVPFFYGAFFGALITNVYHKGETLLSTTVNANYGAVGEHQKDNTLPTAATATEQIIAAAKEAARAAEAADKAATAAIDAACFAAATEQIIAAAKQAARAAEAADKAATTAATAATDAAKAATATTAVASVAPPASSSSSTTSSGSGSDDPLSSSLISTIDIDDIDLSSNFNSNSTLRSDIIKITHNPNEALITVHLKKEKGPDLKGRVCFNPVIRGRLSGPALSIIEWRTASAQAQGQVPYVEEIVGQYKVPSPGRYYIEIIGIMCNHRYYDKNHNMKNDCVIDARQNRLTANGAAIDISDGVGIDTSMSEAFSDAATAGYWKWNDTRQPLPQPLFTRFQRPNCTETDSLCAKEADRSRFKPYQFNFHPELRLKLEKTITLASPLSPMKRLYTPKPATEEEEDNGAKANTENITMSKTRICLIGDSHSYRMAPVMKSVLSHLNSTIEATFAEIHHPHDVGEYVFDTKFFNSIENNHGERIRYIHKENIEKGIGIYKKYMITVQPYDCTHVVITLGQWPLAARPINENKVAKSFAEYQREMEGVIKLAEYERDMEGVMKLAIRAREKLGFKLFFRSIHYNPLKERSLSCPPEDWRIPPVIDRYNSVLRSLCDRYNLTLLDTDAFIGPMWDHSPDWNHLQDWVAFPEALYLLGQLLR